MKTQCIGVIAGACALFSAGDVAAAPQNYSSKYVVQEINASQGAGTIHSLLAAGLMGAKGYGNVVIDGDDEAQLLAKCQAATPDSTTWPNGCDLAGFVSAMTAHFPGQSWVKSIYAGDHAGQQAAVNQQVSALVNYRSPVIVPLYGQVDHWATIVRMYADIAVNPWVISKVWFYDAGDPLFVEDVEFNMYEDGLKSFSGAVYKTTYYKIFAPLSISPNDPFYGKHVFAFEPPLGPNQFSQQMLVPAGQRLEFAPGVALLGDGERMTADLASDLVWDALDVEGLLDDRQYRRLAELGTAGESVEVRGFKADGQPWNYFVVPIHDVDTGGVLGLVGLSADDGAFEQIRSFSAPRRVAFHDARSARAAAERLLRRGESVRGGQITWDPRCGDSYCRSPELPYYEYTIVGADRRSAGRVVVPIQGGALRR